MTADAMDVIATAGHVDHGKSALVRALTAVLVDSGIDAVAVDADARVGGGGAPEHPLPSAAVSLPPDFADPLRAGSPPVVGYVEGDRTLLNLRSLPSADDEVLAAAVVEVARRWT